MANTSVLAVFERFWLHITAALSNKADIAHTHDDRYYTESEVDTKVSTLNTAINGKAASSHTHTKLSNKYTSRPTTANIASSEDRKGSLEFFTATSSMTTGKPPYDAHILHMNWDNTEGWDAQLAVRGSSTAGLAVRGMNGGTWGDWTEVATQDYVRDAISNIGSSTASGCVSEFDSGVISYAAGSTYYNSKDSKSKFYLVTAKHSSYGSHSWVIDFNYLTTSNQYFRVQVGASGSSPVWITIQVKKDSSNRLVVGIAPDCTNVTMTQVCGYY